MGLFDRFRKPTDVDQPLRKRLVDLVYTAVRDPDGRIHVEDAISAAATMVAERCIDAAGDFPLREHEFTPGSPVFSTRANELICGDVSEEGVSQIPADSIVGMLRARLDRSMYSDAEFPNLPDVFRQFAARIGGPVEWGRVPLSVPENHFPFIRPLQISYETRTRVDDILAPVRHDKARCLRIATESLAEILTEVASAIDHMLALTLAVETINCMAKTAPMTERAMRQAQQKKE